MVLNFVFQVLMDVLMFVLVALVAGGAVFTWCHVILVSRRVRRDEGLEGAAAAVPAAVPVMVAGGGAAEAVAGVPG